MANEKRLIDANELLKVLKHRVKGNEDSGIVLGTNSTLEIMEEWVRSIPTVDAVEVVHGRWIDSYAVDSNGKKVYDSIDCSVCEEVYKIESHDREYWKGRFKRCFCCGAKMDGDGNGC